MGKFFFFFALAGVMGGVYWYFNRASHHDWRDEAVDMASKARDRVDDMVDRARDAVHA